MAHKPSKLTSKDMQRLADPATFLRIAAARAVAERSLAGILVRATAAKLAERLAGRDPRTLTCEIASNRDPTWELSMSLI
jgi:hypothetical protein